MENEIVLENTKEYFKDDASYEKFINVLMDATKANEICGIEYEGEVVCCIIRRKCNISTITLLESEPLGLIRNPEIYSKMTFANTRLAKLSKLLLEQHQLEPFEIDYRIEWEDGKIYQGTYNLNFQNAHPDLGKNAKNFMELNSARRVPPFITLEQHVKELKSKGINIKENADFLDNHEFD